MLAFNRSAFIAALALTTTIVGCSALSTFSPPKAASTNNLFAAPFVSLQRADLKKKLIRAASQKDEAVVLSLVDQLATLNPTDCPTRGLQGYKSSNSKAPLNGQWQLLYTNARDAEGPARTQKNKKDEPFGDSVANGVNVQTGQRIEATTGECINFIQLSSDDEASTKPLPFDRLDITIQMTPLTDTRVRLDFLKGRVQNPNAPLPFLRDFRFQFPPAAVGDFLAQLQGKDPKVEPPAYFDVLYIDNELRAHRTGEGKIFVQQRAK